MGGGGNQEARHEWRMKGMETWDRWQSMVQMNGLGANRDSSPKGSKGANRKINQKCRIKVQMGSQDKIENPDRSGIATGGMGREA